MTKQSILLPLIWIALHSPAITNKAYAIVTNKNEISKEFDVISHRAELESNVETTRMQAISSIGTGAMSEVFSPNEDTVSDLKGIDELSLESKGRESRSLDANKYFNEFETDYTKPGAPSHKKDVDEIVDATEKKLRDLTEILRKNGIDCKEYAKTEEVKDPYYIKIEKTQHKEVEYDAKFCEYPRNIYNCHDGASVTCEKRNVKCNEWKLENIHVSGGELVDKAHGAFHFDHVADKVFEMKLYSSNSARPNRYHWWQFAPSYNSVPAMKSYLLNRHKPSSNYNFIEISDDMNFGWEGGIFSVCGRSHCGRILGGKDHAWNTYIIAYRHRECENICDQWSREKWDEICSLK